MCDTSYPYKVSVIVPIYNVAEFLPACLDSLVNQTLDGLEVLLMDNGSTDGSEKIADDYVRQYPHFKVWHLPNGLAYARNLGIREAQGKYLGFVDADDILAPDMYERLYCTAERDQSEMAICDAARFDSSHEWVSSLHGRAFRHLKPVTHITENSDLLYDTAVWNKVIRRDFWAEHGVEFLPDIWYEDLPFALTAHFAASRVSVVYTTGYMWRQRDGATRSITQGTPTIKNLQDRIQILLILKEIFADKPRALQEEYDLKALRVDLLIFVKECAVVKKSEALTRMRIIRDYLIEYMPKSVLDRLSLLERRLYDCVVQNDYNGLCQAVNYRTETMEKGIISERDGRFYLSLPADIFGASETDYTEELRVRPVKAHVTGVSAEDGTLTISGYLYLPRLNIQMGEQEISAFLCDEITGEKTALPLTYTQNTALTAERGRVVNPVTAEEAQYCYDGTGFTVTVNADSIPSGTCQNAVILLEYRNRLTSGKAVLKGMRASYCDWVDGLGTVKDNVLLHTNVGAFRTLLISAAAIPCFLLGFQPNAAGVVLMFDRTVQKLTGKSANAAFEINAASETVTVPADRLQDGEEYALFAETEDGFGAPVRTEKSTDLIHTEHCGMVLRSNKSHTVHLFYAEAFSCVRHPQAKGNMLCFGTTNLGAINPNRNRARIVIPDELRGCDTVLATASTRLGEDGRLRADFKLKFDTPRIAEKLYGGRRDVYMEYLQTNEAGNVLACDRHMLVSKTYFKESFDIGSLGVQVYKTAPGNVRLLAQSRWSEEENTPEKRRALRSRHDAAYRSEPLQKRLILFESAQGDTFSGSPKAVYEDVQKRYPEFKCVWALKDERIPIGGSGKRVRRDSIAYYRLLLTAKYLVTDEELPAYYQKRAGQTHLLTPSNTDSDSAQAVRLAAQAMRRERLRIRLHRIKKSIVKRLK